MVAVAAALLAATTMRQTFEQAVVGMEPIGKGVCTVGQEEYPCIQATRTFFVIFEGNTPVGVMNAEMEYVWKK